MKRIAILGATGSIGVNTLDVIGAHPDRFEVFALSGRSRIALLAEQCRRFRPRVAVVADRDAARQLRTVLGSDAAGIDIAFGPGALEQVAADPQCDVVMAAIVGAAGLPSTLAAVRAGKRVLLANKESLVVGGRLLMAEAERSGAELLPVDSEHSAIFQCLPPQRRDWPKQVLRLLLTASGGPFLERPLDSFGDITPQQAVAHPNWVMGRKISVDSATMMNKALEVIEAHVLFGFPAERIDVLIHPQSIVHSMVEMIDGAVIAQLGTPDMRMPIALALGHPERIASNASRLDFLHLRALDFRAPEPARFPCLQLAYDALAADEGATTVLNAANEVAVAAFLDGRIGFEAIAASCAEALQAGWPRPATLDALLALDAQVRADTRRRLGLGDETTTTEALAS